jgi:hypothetical protein
MDTNEPCAALSEIGYCEGYAWYTVAERGVDQETSARRDGASAVRRRTSDDGTRDRDSRWGSLSILSAE